jgi:hypothetical protein
VCDPAVQPTQPDTLRAVRLTFVGSHRGQLGYHAARRSAHGRGRFAGSTAGSRRVRQPTNESDRTLWPAGARGRGSVARSVLTPSYLVPGRGPVRST